MGIEKDKLESILYEVAKRAYDDNKEIELITLIPKEGRSISDVIESFEDKYNVEVEFGLFDENKNEYAIWFEIPKDFKRDEFFRELKKHTDTGRIKRKFEKSNCLSAASYLLEHGRLKKPERLERFG